MSSIRRRRTSGASSSAWNVGVYQFDPGFSVTIAREGDHLTAKLPGRSPAPLRAETRIMFALDAPDVLLRFSVSPLGKVTGLAMEEGGRRRLALKIK